MSDFLKFSQSVHAQYMSMGGKELYQVSMDKDAFYAAYLAAFPEGTNPLFRERTEHDCSCCRNFIKNLGTVVALDGTQYLTVWDDFKSLPHPYNVVGEAMQKEVRKHFISGVYRTKEGSYGLASNVELGKDGGTIKWNHFHGKVLTRHHHATPEAAAGTINSTVDVFRRGVNEITMDAVQTVLDLIDSNSLYRGAEFRNQVDGFLSLLKGYQENIAGRKEAWAGNNFVWANYDKNGSRIRNTAIGTLLQDLSEGVELEKAVASFENKVSGTNYKRTSALITPKMIDAAVKTLANLGLESAVQRRFAKISDITVNNVLWANSAVKDRSDSGSLTRALLSDSRTKGAVINDREAEKFDVIDIQDFLDQILPTAASVDVLLKSNMATNLMSLTAPVHADVGQLFKWHNNFAWSYNGNITDSIKERVKSAGGNTDAKLRVSLAWHNSDDLDLHTECPDGHIYFRNKGGILDVDMNAGGRTNSVDPVENLSWTKPHDGKYRIVVRQYNQRTNERPGFTLQLENNGNVSEFTYAKGVRGDVEALQFTVVGGVVTSITAHKELTSESISTEVWGLTTQTLVPVDTIMLSPNYWDGENQGNKHWFFMLRGCKNDQMTRGIYNEFLTNDLHEHRKVFEVLGSQTMCPVVDDQLSGLGFSSTRQDRIVVRVTRADGGQKHFNLQF